MVACFEYTEGHHLLILHRVRHTDRCRFDDRRMRIEDRLDFGWPQTFASDLDRVIATTEDIPQTVLIDGGKIAMHPQPGDALPIGRVIVLLLVIVPKS